MLVWMALIASGFEHAETFGNCKEETRASRRESKEAVGQRFHLQPFFPTSPFLRSAQQAWWI
jgi:hypothetical protein